MRILSVVGARPNFVKIAPFIREVSKHKDISHKLVHTGQHYDDAMSGTFLRTLKIKNCVSLRPARLRGEARVRDIRHKLSVIFRKERPDIVVVVGDVDSTRAAALEAARHGIKVAHIEAGLRSFDPTMPEEFNRIAADSVSSYLFVTEPSAVRNLIDEGNPRDRIFFVGNIMIDSLVMCAGRIKRSKVLKRFGLKKKGYSLVTLHRPSNVDTRYGLGRIAEFLKKAAKITGIVYPVHPRTEKMLKKYGYWNRIKKIKGLIITKPLDYIDFLKLLSDCRCAITDSGGIQEEATYLGVPCFTMRKNTERPVTVALGTNKIVGDDYDGLLRIMDKIPVRKGIKKPSLWDGKTASRIVRILRKTN